MMYITESAPETELSCVKAEHNMKNMQNPQYDLSVHRGIIVNDWTIIVVRTDIMKNFLLYGFSSGFVGRYLRNAIAFAKVKARATAQIIAYILKVRIHAAGVCGHT